LRFGTRLNAGETCIAPRRLIVVQSIAEDLLTMLRTARVPRLLIERVNDDRAALRRVNAGDFALGASLFTRDLAAAQSLAAQLHTGFVTINDLIVPTADPRLPFGGIKASGFGSTRGAEGLLEMTYPHVVITRRGRMHPHFDAPSPGDSTLFSTYLRAVHGAHRCAGLRDLLIALCSRKK
jgi:acyl-CoA reductase-like NAD-dependent aldehyde dehydrogenase